MGHLRAIRSCDPHISAPWGGDKQPVIYVSLYKVQQYIEWLSTITGKTYRLLSEAEYEYAARAGTQTAYPWGDDLGNDNEDCSGCGSQWVGQPAPVGSFPPNKFGLYDMVGNVWEWISDCYHSSYEINTPNGKTDAPTDGSAWTANADCKMHVVRGGSWAVGPTSIRSARRDQTLSDNGGGDFNLSFRVARTLAH
jgi:formylglycine-generating enzyme required for sulfatase activity